MSSETSKLTRKQAKAITALLDNSTLKGAAKDADISVRSIYRWLKEPYFRTALDQAATRVIGESVVSLIADMRDNFQVMRTVRDDLDNPPGVRLRAAQLLDASLLKWRELLDLEERLTRLEERVYE